MTTCQILITQIQNNSSTFIKSNRPVSAKKWFKSNPSEIVKLKKEQEIFEETEKSMILFNKHADLF